MSQMKFTIAMDSSSNVLELADVSFASVPLKIVTDEREFTDDATLNREEMLTYLST